VEDVLPRQGEVVSTTMNDITPRADFEVGSDIRLTHELRDTQGVIQSGEAGNLTIAIRLPDGTLEGNVPSIAEDGSTGTYEATYTTSQAGLHLVSWTWATAADDVEEYYFVTKTVRTAADADVPHTDDLYFIRKLLVDRSGRYDLVESVPGYVDAGANSFINDAQRWLDRNTNIGNAVVTWTETILQGEYYVDLTNVRAVRYLRIYHATEGWSEPDRVSLQDLYEFIGADDQTLDDIDEGFPRAYAVAGLRSKTAPHSDTSLSDVRVYFVAPADGTYTFEFEALVYSPTLASDTDKSYWTREHPTLLMWATLWMIETWYRNTQGANDWFIAITNYLTGMEHDAVDIWVVEEVRPTTFRSSNAFDFLWLWLLQKGAVGFTLRRAARC